MRGPSSIQNQRAGLGTSGWSGIGLGPVHALGVSPVRVPSGLPGTVWAAVDDVGFE